MALACGSLACFSFQNAWGGLHNWGPQLSLGFFSLPSIDADITENIVHLVLARIKGAPAGVKGISLFIVPKFLVKPDGRYCTLAFLV